MSIFNYDQMVVEIARSDNLAEELPKVFERLPSKERITKLALDYSKKRDSLEIVLGSLMDALFSGRGDKAILGLAEAYSHTHFWKTADDKLAIIADRLSNKYVLDVFDIYAGTEVFDKITEALVLLSTKSDDETVETAAHALINLKDMPDRAGLVAEDFLHHIQYGNARGFAACYSMASVASLLKSAGKGELELQNYISSLVNDACRTGNEQAARAAIDVINSFEGFNTAKKVYDELGGLLVNTKRDGVAFIEAVNAISMYRGSHKSGEVAYEIRSAATNAIGGQSTEESLAAATKAAVEAAERYSGNRSHTGIPLDRVNGYVWKHRLTFSDRWNGLKGYRAYQELKKRNAQHQILVPDEMNVGTYYQTDGGLAVVPEEIFVERDREVLTDISRRISNNQIGIVKNLLIPPTEVQNLVKTAVKFNSSKTQGDIKLGNLVYTATRLLEYAA